MTLSKGKRKIIIITLLSITITSSVILGMIFLVNHWMHKLTIENQQEKKRLEYMEKEKKEQELLTEKLIGELSIEDKEKIETLNTYENAMIRYSDYAIHMNYFYDSLLKIKDQENSFKKVKNTNEMKKEIENYDKLNNYLKKNIMDISQKLGCSKQAAEELNYSILKKDWPLVENLIFINLIRKDNDSKKFYKEIYCNAIKMNRQLNDGAKVSFYFHNKEEDKVLKEKTKSYIDEFWQSNSGENLSTKEHIEKTKEILKLAKENNNHLNDIYKHMIEQIELEFSNMEI